jgi:hypothetical protein
LGISTEVQQLVLRLPVKKKEQITLPRSSLALIAVKTQGKPTGCLSLKIPELGGIVN